MKRFKDILVGVDLSQGDQLVSNEAPPPTVEAIERALWLAKVNSARLRFFYALDVSPAAQRLIEASEGRNEGTVLDKANAALSELVRRASAEGIDADFKVQFGKSWLETIRLVLRDEHDLVVAGTRRLGAARGFLMGSTGIKLLRKCPCPVWITEPQPEQEIKSILVAHCLRPVGDFAMALGCSMAQLHGSKLHVVHSLEFPELDSALPSVVASEDEAIHQAKAKEHIELQLKNYEFALSPEIHIVTDRPNCAVLEHIEKFEIELLVMGTIARTGIAGFITGNTAERLLPQIPCSVLAVKPPGFITPVADK